MANYSNIKHQHNNSSPLYRVLLLLLALYSLVQPSQAQPYFNRLYTNNATGSIYMSVCPQGNAGNFLAIANVIDSLTGKSGVRALQMNTEGTILNSSFLVQSEYPLCDLYARQAAFCVVDENSFALVGDLNFPDGRGNYSFVILIDSTATLKKFKAYVNPYPSSTDSLIITKSIAFDGTNLIMLSNITNKTDYTKQLLTKFDTALNTLWSKTYIEGANPRKLVYSLHVDDSGYVLGGNSDWGDPTTNTFQSEAFVFRTDTSGWVQWTWKSPLKMGPAADIIRSTDGGYIFSSMGNTYDANPSPTIADWRAQEVLVKLSDSGKFLWQKVPYAPRYSGLGTTTIRLLPTWDSGFKITRPWADSPYVEGDSVFANLRSYNKDGLLKNSRKFPLPTPMPMIGIVRLHDLTYTSDKDIVIAGYFQNNAKGAAEPSQRGWLLKLDSNGCMGASDPQCDPASIPPILVGDKTTYRIYPNPSTGSIVIASPHAVIPNTSLRGGGTTTKQTEASVYDLLGRVVYRQALSFSNNEASIRLNLPPATYILELQDPGGNAHRERIVIQ
jgi:hypothetical protein